MNSWWHRNRTGMVERRPTLGLLAHVVQIIGIVIVAFPIYLAFIASTYTTAEITQMRPLSLLPGAHFIETYSVALFGGQSSYGSRIAPALPGMVVSFVSAMIIAVGKIAISLLSAFAIVDATTHGGPGKATATLVYKVYYDGFKALDMGGSAAQSVVLMVIVIALTVVQFRYVEKKVQY